MDALPKDALYLAHWEPKLAVWEQKLCHQRKCHELKNW